MGDGQWRFNTAGCRLWLTTQIIAVAGARCKPTRYCGPWNVTYCTLATIAIPCFAEAANPTRGHGTLIWRRPSFRNDRMSRERKLRFGLVRGADLGPQGE